ncbi:membrane protein [Vallitalea sediminicola]
MKLDFKNSIKIASVYIGTVLGAGFASGQELMKFFAYYGYKGMIGLLLTGVMFAVIGWAVLEILFFNKSTSYKEFIYPIAGKTFGKILELSVIFFMFVCFCAMFAGSGALFQQRFHIPYQVGVLVMAVCCYITFLFDVKGVIAVNSILAPILLVGVLIVGLYMWFFRSTTVMNKVVEVFLVVRDNWLSSTIIYVSYNIITAVVVLTTLHKLVKSKFIARLGSLLAGIALGMIGIILGFVILVHYSDIQGIEIPMLAIVMRYAKVLQYIYIVVLICAMFTTAVANGYGILSKLKLSTAKHGKIKLAVFILFAVIFSQIGFSNMVGKIYPIFGYIGVFEVILILVYFVKMKYEQFKVKIKNSMFPFRKTFTKNIKSR